MNIFKDVPDELFFLVKKKFSHNPVSDDNYTPNELMKPTRMLILENRYDNKIVRSASSLIWTVIASSLHRIMSDGLMGNSYSSIQKVRQTLELIENGVNAKWTEDDLKEINESFSIAYNNRNNIKIKKIPKNWFKYDFDGTTIYDKVDIFETRNKKYISDTKFVVANTYRFLDSRMKEFEIVMNIRRFLVEKTMGFNINNMYLNFIIKDWNQMDKSRFQSEYPNPVEKIKIKRIDDDEIIDFVMSKVNEIHANISLPDNMLIKCNENDRWRTKDKIHIFKKTQRGYFSKKAFAIVDSDEERIRTCVAAAKISGKNYQLSDKELLKYMNANYKIENVSGVDKRCNPTFCHCCEFCDYYKNRED
jgi:hypothetical protein